MLERTRRLLAHADDYDEALSWAQKTVGTWLDKDVPKHLIAAAFSFVFPDHREFFEVALSGPDTEAVPNYLFASVSRADDVGAIRNGKRDRQFWDGAYGLHLAKCFGADGYELMRNHLWDKNDVAYALAISPYSGQAPAEDMLRFLEERVTRSFVEAYFANHTQWLHLLEAASKGKKPAQKAAAKIVAKLQG